MAFTGALGTIGIFGTTESATRNCAFRSSEASRLFAARSAGGHSSCDALGVISSAARSDAVQYVYVIESVSFPGKGTA